MMEKAAVAKNLIKLIRCNGALPSRFNVTAIYYSIPSRPLLPWRSKPLVSYVTALYSTALRYTGEHNTSTVDLLNTSEVLGKTKILQ